MDNNELRDSMEKAFETGYLHLKRMNFANSKVKKFLPITRDNYYLLDDETIGFLDQYIFRFSKTQDLIGSRIFPLTLQTLAEPVEDKPFIDVLNRLEKLNIIDSAQNWIELRKIRNDIAHEYPSNLNERIEGINILFENLTTFRQILNRCSQVLEEHGLKNS
ncbi:hypothetical protein [Marinilabilia sp.]|uniref:hypothetical protein n=1 Tax=Marinilabilia sp. TaxID=2021252 RepID=UPI0025BF87EA|nr:hypothetical protein [Marinilabilia sp.]